MEDLAAEVQAWVDTHWSEDITVGKWWSLLAEAGYSMPQWPKGFGGFGATSAQARIVLSVLARNEVIGPPSAGMGFTLSGPTILVHGTDEQKERYLGAIARGEEWWCQLFSEPGSGSDLASVGLTAVRDGDEWVVNGQKVWNSLAEHGDMGMLLARTDPSKPKHRGITYFLIDMHQPGIDVRPLRQMNGSSMFCEVFLSDARVPDAARLGDVDDGWRVAQATLAAERNASAGGGLAGLVAARPGRRGDLDLPVGQVLVRARREAEEAAAHSSPIKGYAVPWRYMIELAQERGRDRDPVIRQELVRYLSNVRVNGWTMQRIAAARGRLTGADGSIAKLTTSRICQQSREVAYRVVGAEGLLWGPDSPAGGDLQTACLGSLGTRLGGGTDEIQLNVLGERGLGLPREPADDRDVPYRDLKVGTQRAG